MPPEQWLRALLLQALYTIRSERLLIEQLEYNLLFRWFVGLAMDAPVWVPTTFTKNRERLIAGDIARAFFAAAIAQAEAARLLSDEHFTVDGSLLQAWASHKSFRPTDQRRFVQPLRARGTTPHVAAKRRRSVLDARTTRHAGYAVSQRKRKLVEQVFGWLKTVAGLRQVKHRGGPKVDWQVTFAAAAYNLVRLRRLRTVLA